MEAGDLCELEQATCSLSTTLRENLAEHFLKGTPFPYLLNKSEFYHHEFYINEYVLIPRPETEYLVDLIVNEFKGKVDRVLDIGTGSGVILLSLLSHGVGSSGMAGDISIEALKVARINARRLRVRNAEFIQSDRLAKIEGKFDLIVSNPPYIKASSHRSLVHSSVNTYEPHLALYLPDDEYVAWFKKFFEEVRDHLHGTFFMEGHELELEAQSKMMTELGFKEVKVINDLSGVPRFLCGQV